MIQRQKQWLARLRRVDASPATSRIRNAGLSSLGMAFHKAVQFLVTLVSLPLMLHYLGEVQFGIFMAIIGFTQWFLLDLGLGDAVKIRLIQAFAHRRLDTARRYVSVGIAGLVLVSVLFTLAFAVLYPRLPWSRIFRAETAEGASQAAECLAVAMTMVLLAIPLRLLREIYTADQRGYVYSLWLTGATLVSLPAIALAAHLDLGMPGLAFAMHGTVVVGLVGCALYLFIRDNPALRPRFSDIEPVLWRPLLPDSVSFLVLGVGLMAINGTDIFLVNYYRGGSEAAIYAFSWRIFVYLHTFVGFLTYPAWPALGDALAASDRGWFKKMVKILGVVVLIGSVLPVALLIVLGQQLVTLWSGGIIEVPGLLLLLLGAYTFLRIVVDYAGFILRALGRVRAQAMATLVEAVLHVSLGILLVRQMGLVGMALGGLLALVLTRGWLLPLECYLGIRSILTQDETEALA